MDFFALSKFTIVRLLYHGMHMEFKKGKKLHKTKNISSLFNRWARSILSGKLYFPEREKADHVFYFGTRNDKYALLNLRDKILDSTFTYYHGHDVSEAGSRSKKFPFWLSYTLGLLSYLLFWKARQAITRRFRPTHPNINYEYKICLLLGHYFAAKLVLKMCKPKYFWMSNDHTDINVGLLYASKCQKIISIYVQHASVSSLFPPLNFSYAFLDGKIALTTYEKIGIGGTKCYLSGISKMDGYINKYPRKNAKSKILLCINPLDDVLVFENLIERLINMGYIVKLRKHPYFMGILKCESKIEVSCEGVFMDSLSDIDLLIAGDSNVHLEATLTNIPCFYLSTSNYFDYYGFLQNDLIVWGGREVDECLKQVQAYCCDEDVYLRAESYCASVRTEFENQSTAFILNKLGIE